MIGGVGRVPFVTAKGEGSKQIIVSADENQAAS